MQWAPIPNKQVNSYAGMRAIVKLCCVLAQSRVFECFWCSSCSSRLLRTWKLETSEPSSLSSRSTPFARTEEGIPQLCSAMTLLFHSFWRLHSPLNIGQKGMSGMSGDPSHQVPLGSAPSWIPFFFGTLRSCGVCWIWWVQSWDTTRACDTSLITHHSSCRFRRSQAQKSSAQQGATEAVRGNRVQRKKMYLDDDLQGIIPKESLTRLLLCFQQVPPLSTLIYGQICHEGYQLLGPCQSSSGNGIKTFLHPRRGSECQEHVFPWSTQIIHVFLVDVCVHHLDAEQKKHVHLIEESKSQKLICFFSNCGTVSGILEDFHHVQLPTLPFFPWAGQPVLGGFGGASPSNWTASSPDDRISTYQVYTWDFPGFCRDYYQDTYDVHWFYTFFWGMNRMNHP